MNDSDTSRPRSEKEIFFEALDKKTPEERAAFLDKACGTNPLLRAKVDALLADHFQRDEFMKEPAVDASAPTLAAPGPVEVPAQILGRYKLLERIGEGGFGEVWMAEQREPVKRRVALKIIKLGMDTKQVVARFEAERQALAMMDHPNIAKVFDGGVTDTGRPYFVMELVRGTPITKFSDENNLSTTERLDLFVSVCQAIQHAHQKGIIHRDIKPSNVLVSMHDDKPVVKVIDFGIAKATQQELTEKTVFTQMQQFIGTPAYMSPEQAGLSGLDIDTRSDVYSLGVLLYELLTGRTPLDPRELTTGGYDEMRRRIKEVEAPRPSTRISSLTNAELTDIAKHRKVEPHRLKRLLRGDLDWVILKALEKDRTRRYETATAFAEDIRRYLNNEPVTAVPPTVIYLFGKYARRHKTSLAMAAGITIMLVVSATYSAAQAVKAGRAAKAAREAEQLKSIALGSAEQERDRATQMAAKLDSANDRLKGAATRAEFATGVHLLESDQLPKGIAHLARALRTDPTYWPAATRLISTLTDRGIAMDDLPPVTHDGPIYDHVLDRTTGLLATRGKNYDLRIWNAWKAEKLKDIPATGNRKMPSLSPDGRRVMFVDTNGAALVFEPFTNPRTPLAMLRPDGRVVEAVLSPGNAGLSAGEKAGAQTAGKGAGAPRLIAATRLAAGTVQLWNAETGAPLSQPMSGSSTNGGFLSFTRDGKWLVASFADGQVGVWPAPSQTGAVRFLSAAAHSLLTLAPDSKTLVERMADGLSIRFWDLTTGTARSDATKLSEPLCPVVGEPGTVPWGTTHQHDFEFSEDGRHMLAVSHGTFPPYANLILHPRVETHLLDTSTGKLLHTISDANVTHHVENLVSGLGAMVINTNRLVIRELATGKLLAERPFPSDWIVTAQFSPAGDRILVALTDHRLIMFDALTLVSLTHAGDLVHISNTAGGSGRAPGQTYFMKHGPRLGGSGESNPLEFSPEGEVFFTHYGDGSLQMWDAFEGVPIADPMPELGGHIDFSGDGRWLVVERKYGWWGSRDNSKGWVRVVGRDLSAARHRPMPYTGWAPVLHFSPDGRYGLVGSSGLVVFDPATGEAIRRIDESETGKIGHVEGTTWLINEAWFSPSGEKIVAICHDETSRVVKVFETATGKTLQELPTPRMSQPYRVRFVGENRVVTASWTYQEGVLPLKLWDLESGRVIAEAKPPAGPGIFDVSRDGRRIASCDSDIALIDAATLQPIGPVLRHGTSLGLYHVTFSPDSRRLVTGSNDGTIRVWKAETGELEAEFVHGDVPRWVEVSPDSQRIMATGSGRYDVPSAANVWEFATGSTRRVGSPMIQPNTIVNARFSADNQFVMAGDRSGVAQLWDLETSLPILNPMFVDGPAGVTRVGINPQMTRVFAVAGNGNQLHHRPLPPRNAPAPDWLPQLAEAIAGQRINDHGAMEALMDQALREAKALVAQLPANADDFYAKWGRWLLADHATRLVAPLALMTVPQEVEELVGQGNLASLRRAHRISPVNASVMAALARELAASLVTREAADLASGSRSAAEWFADQAVQRAPLSIEAHWSQAEVLLRLNQPAAARASLNNAMRLQADNPNVLAIQAELARRDGQTNEAHGLLARALNAPAPKTTSAYLQLASVASHPDFFAEASLRNRMERRLAGRPLNLPAQFIDLTPWFTENVTGAQTNSAKTAAGFAAPVFNVGGIPFDFRSLVGFSTLPTTTGKHKSVLGIPIGQRCARLHLHAGGAQGGLRLRVHYADSQTREVPLPMTREDGVVSWDNPQPEIVVQTIDLLAQPNAEPRVAAITVQTSPDPVIAAQPQPAYPRITLGQPLEFNVVVATPGTWSYQWNANNQPIVGATNATFRIASTTAKDLASYRVEVRSTLIDPASKVVRSRPVWAVDAANPVIHGALMEELYLEVPGGAVQDLLKSPKFPNRPDEVENATSLEAPSGPHDNFGRRLSGWLAPKETASYVFYICSDDASRLSLSSDETAAKLTEIAKLSGYKAGARSWETLDPESISKPVRLEAGKRYFVEVLHKDGAQGDHVSVAWRKAGEPAPKNGDAPISGEFLERPTE